MPKPRAKSKVKVSYQKARQTPSQRRGQAWINPPKTPHGLSPLAAYIEDNRAEGITVRELIEQFQEYDCEHPVEMQHVVASGAGYRFVRCGMCNRVEKRTARKTEGEKDG